MKIQNLILALAVSASAGLTGTAYAQTATPRIRHAITPKVMR